MRNYANHIKTLASVTIIYDSGSPVNVPVENPNYHKIIDHLERHEFEEAALLADAGLKIEKHTEGKFKVEDGVVVIDGEKLPKNLSERLLQFVDQKIPTRALENFWDNLKGNPSEDSKKDLFTFLDKNHYPLTEDGCFVGYKWVRQDFTDYYTGKINNKPGQIIKMDRDQVDADRHSHCSHGLHIAALPYARDVIGKQHHPDGRLLEVKVNPRDVVAVPTDYNAQKLRCCRYEVLRECGTKEAMKEQTYEEKLQKVSKKSETRHEKKKARAEKVKGPKPALTKTMLHPDGQSRLRIPTAMLDGIGARSTIYAYVADVRSRNVMLSAKKPEREVFFLNDYKVTPDRVIRINNSTLSEAKIDAGSKYIARITDGEIEIRKA
jgi:hypothetical protein